MERQLDEEFSRYGTVEKVTIVYDARVSEFFFRPPSIDSLTVSILQTGRSRGFGFIKMSAVDEAAACIEKLNGIVRFFLLHSYYLSTILTPFTSSGNRWTQAPRRLFRD